MDPNAASDGTSATTSKQFQYDASQSLTQLNVGCEFDVVAYSLSSKPRTGCSKKCGEVRWVLFQKISHVAQFSGLFHSNPVDSRLNPRISKKLSRE